MPQLPPGFVLQSQGQSLPPGFEVKQTPVDMGSQEPAAPPPLQSAGPPQDTEFPLTFLPSLGKTSAEKETATLRAQARDLNPVTADISAKMGLAYDPQKAAHKLLSDKFGQDVPVTVGPTGRLEFRNPETGNIQVLNPPGVQLGDILENIPNAAAIIGDLAIGGKGAGRLAVEIGVPSAVTGAVEAGRLFMGMHFGLNDELTSTDVILQGAKAMGLDALGVGTMRGLLGVGTAISGALRGNAENLGISGVVLDKITKEFSDSARMIDEFNVRTAGPKVTPTVGQMSRDSYVLELENNFRKAPITREAFEKRDLANQQAFVEYFQQIHREMQLTPGEIKTWEASRKVADTAQARWKGLQRQITVAKEGTEEEFAKARQELLKPIAGRTETAIGAAIYDGLAVEVKANDALNRKALSSLAKDAKGLPPLTNLPSTQRKATDLRRAMDRVLLPNLDPRDRETATLLEGLAKNPEKGYTFQQINEAVYLLDKAEVKAVGTEDAGIFKGLRQALERDRASWLRSNNNGRLLGQLEKAELDRRNQQAALERTIIGKVVSLKDKGLPAEEIFRHVMSTAENSRMVEQATEIRSKLLPAREVAVRAEARDAIRDGIFSDYQKAALPEGKPNPAGRREWLRKNQDIIAPWVSKQEMAKLKGGMEEFPSRLAKLDAREAKMSQFFQEGGLDFRNPEVLNKVFRENWSNPASHPGNTEKFVAWAKRADPDALHQAQAATLDQMYVSLGTAGGLDFSRLGPMLEGDAGRRRAEALGALFGPEYVTNLRVLHRAIEVTSQGTGEAPPRIQKPFLNDIARAYVGLFTTPGRALTAMQKIRGRAAERLLAESLADPRVLRDVVATSRASQGAKSIVSQIAGFGAYSLLGVPPETDAMPEVPY